MSCVGAIIYKPTMDKANVSRDRRCTGGTKNQLCSCEGREQNIRFNEKDQEGT